MNLPFLLCFSLYLRAIFQVQTPGGLIFRGAILEGFTIGGPYFRNLTVLSKSGAASVQVYPLLSLHNTFSYFKDPHEEKLLSSRILPLTEGAKIEPDVSKDARGCARSS